MTSVVLLCSLMNISTWRLQVKMAASYTSRSRRTHRWENSCQRTVRERSVFQHYHSLIKIFMHSLILLFSLYYLPAVAVLERGCRPTFKILFGTQSSVISSLFVLLFTGCEDGFNALPIWWPAHQWDRYSFTGYKNL